MGPFSSYLFPLKDLKLTLDKLGRVPYYKERPAHRNQMTLSQSYTHLALVHILTYCHIKDNYSGSLFRLLGEDFQERFTYSEVNQIVTYWCDYYTKAVSAILAFIKLYTGPSLTKDGFTLKEAPYWSDLELEVLDRCICALIQ